MNVMERVNRWLAALGGASGLPLALDDDGYCALELADGLRLSVAAAEEGGGVVRLCAPVSEPGPGEQAAVFEQALRRNFFDADLGGAWLALDGDGFELLLCATRPLEGMDGPAFERMFLNFAETAAVLARELRTGGPASAGGAGGAASPESRPGGLAVNFA